MAKFSAAAKKEGELKSTNMADFLVLLSSNGAKAKEINGDIKKPTSRVYECKTCNRRFPTFQALGGHRTSHMRPRVRRNRVEQMIIKKERPKARVHECPVCGLEFPIGQALGGHMRRHKPAVDAAEGHAEEKAGAGKILCLDLNLTPLENDLELTTLRLGLELVEEASIIDFFSCSGGVHK